MFKSFAFYKSSNDNAEFCFVLVTHFATAVPFKLLGCFVLRSALAVIMWSFRLIKYRQWIIKWNFGVNFSLVSLAQNDKAISMTSGPFKKPLKF